jgi:hypothetical protein
VFVSASQADLSLEGRVERTTEPDAVVATLVVSDRDGRVLGRRVLRVPGSSCQPLEASLVLVIAIAIDPGASLPGVVGEADALSEEARTMLEQLDLPELGPQQIAELAVPDPAREVSPPAATPNRPAAGAEPAPARDASPPANEPVPAVALRVSAGITVELGVLPDPAPGATAGVTVAPAWFVPIDVWITGLLEQDHALADEPGQGSLQLIAGGLALCPALELGALVTLRACAGLRAGVLHGSGEGLAQSFSESGPWLEGLLGGGAWLRFGRFSLHAGAGAGAPAVRDTFYYLNRLDQRRVLHRAPPITARFELGAGLHF